MVRSLKLKKLDLNSLSVHRALDFIKKSIHITDMDIIGDLLASKMINLPYWLEAHGSVVGRAKRKLETNIFPMNTFGPTRPWPTSSIQPITRFSRKQNLRTLVSSSRSVKKDTKTSGIYKTNQLIR
jgi:hypothetical protein